MVKSASAPTTLKPACPTSSPVLPLLCLPPLEEKGGLSLTHTVLLTLNFRSILCSLMLPLRPSNYIVFSHSTF